MKTPLLICLLPCLLAVSAEVLPSYVSEGCWNPVEDLKSFRKPGREVNWSKWPDLSSTINKCGEFAEEKGCVIFAIQFWGECYCTTDVNVDYKKNKKSSNCINGVGKENANEVYRIKGCHENGHTYKIGEEIPNPEPCLSCKCDPTEKMYCQASMCPPNSVCPVPKKVRGQCCPVCVCEDNDHNSYSNGQTWTSRLHSTCVDCECTGGRAVCQPHVCPELTCKETIKKPGQCCAECKQKAQPMTVPTRPTLPTFSFPFPFPDFKRGEEAVVDDMAKIVKKRMAMRKKKKQ